MAIYDSIRNFILPSSLESSVCMCVCVCVYMCARVCAHACTHVLGSLDRALNWGSRSTDVYGFNLCCDNLLNSLEFFCALY